MSEREELEMEVRELWALRWPDGTVSGALYGDAAESTVRVGASCVEAEVVCRTETIHRSPWRAEPDVVGLQDGYRPKRPLPEYPYEEYAERYDPR